MMMKEAVIVAAARTAVGKSGKGSLRTTRPDDLAALVIQDVLKQAPAVDASQIEAVSYTHLRAHETVLDLVCRLLLEKKKNIRSTSLEHKLTLMIKTTTVNKQTPPKTTH